MHFSDKPPTKNKNWHTILSTYTTNGDQANLTWYTSAKTPTHKRTHKAAIKTRIPETANTKQTKMRTPYSIGTCSHIHTNTHASNKNMEKKNNKYFHTLWFYTPWCPVAIYLFVNSVECTQWFVCMCLSGLYFSTQCLMKIPPFVHYMYFLFVMCGDCWLGWVWVWFGSLCFALRVQLLIVLSHSSCWWIMFIVLRLVVWVYVYV